MSEAELHMLNARLIGGQLNKARRGELPMPTPLGYVVGPDGKLMLDPDEQIQSIVRLVFDTFQRSGSAGAVVRYFREQALAWPQRVATGPRAGMINDNYFCQLPRTRSAGSWTHPEPCETARFPRGGRVGHGCAGSAIARETDVGEDVGGGRGGRGNERADSATVAEWSVAVDGEGAADVADAGGPVRRGVGVGGGAAAGGRHRRPAAGADAVQGAVPAASGSLSGGTATDAATAGPRLIFPVFSRVFPDSRHLQRPRPGKPPCRPPGDKEVGVRLLKRCAVEAMTGLSRSTIYEGMEAGWFPRPIRIGPRAVRWYEHEIVDYIKRCPRAGSSRVQGD